MNFLPKFFSYLIYSNIFIAICAAGLSLFTLLSFDIENQAIEICSLVFFATLFTYSFHRKIGLNFSSFSTHNPHFHWMKSHPNLLFSHMLISFIVCLFILMILPFKTLLIILPLGILAFLYIYPFSWRKKSTCLRSIPFLKPFLIAIVWTGITVLLPLITNFGWEVLSQTRFQLFALCISLFVFGQCIPFDIKDSLQDKKGNLKTFATEFGPRTAKTICLFAYILALIPFIFLSDYWGISTTFSMAFMMSILLSGFFIGFLPSNKSDWHYYILLESSFILPITFNQILMLL